MPEGLTAEPRAKWLGDVHGVARRPGMHVRRLWRGVGSGGSEMPGSERGGRGEGLFVAPDHHLTTSDKVPCEGEGQTSE